MFYEQLGKHMKQKNIQTILVDTLMKKKQVMMLSVTMPAETRGFYEKLLLDPHEIRLNEKSKLMPQGLLQHYVKLDEKAKNRKLNIVILV
eukprot:12152545-Heterocapsa_arctica.AAC.1